MCWLCYQQKLLHIGTVLMLLVLLLMKSVADAVGPAVGSCRLFGPARRLCLPFPELPHHTGPGMSQSIFYTPEPNKKISERIILTTTLPVHTT
jgi:hypothetical protein